MPEYPLACWWDEWPEPRVPLGEAQMKYASKPVPEDFEGLPFTFRMFYCLRVPLQKLAWLIFPRTRQFNILYVVGGITREICF